MDPSFFPPVAAPAAPSEVLDGLTDHDARLIFDLVAQLRPNTEILARYQMTAADLLKKAGSPMWASAFRETKKVWNSDMNTAQRIRLKAAFLLEDSLIPLFNIIRSDQMPASQKLAAIEQLTKISTVANVPKEPGAGERHNITINIGGNKPPLVVTVEKTNGGTTIDAV